MVVVAAPGLSDTLLAGEGLMAAIEGLTAVDFALLGSSSLITGVPCSWVEQTP